MTSLDSILKSRDITLPTKVRLVKAMVFPVVMYGCESWIVKQAERQRIDAFELWCWRRCWGPPSLEFSRQEYWSGLLFPPPGNLRNPGIKPMSLMSPALAGRFFTANAT